MLGRFHLCRSWVPKDGAEENMQAEAVVLCGLFIRDSEKIIEFNLSDLSLSRFPLSTFGTPCLVPGRTRKHRSLRPRRCRKFACLVTAIAGGRLYPEAWVGASGCLRLFEHPGLDLARTHQSLLCAGTCSKP